MTSIPSHLWLATLSVSAVVHAAIVLPSLAFEEPQAAGIYAPKSDRSAPLQVDIAPAHSMTVRFDPPKKAELPQPPPEPVLAPIPTEQVAAPEPPTPEPPPEVTPPKVAKRTPARKARRARPDPVEPPKVAAGHAQRITSTGDTPDPEGPPPSDLQNAGSGAVADAASHAPGGASPDGTDDGVGAQPATPARPAVDRDRLLRRYLRKVARAVQTRFEYPRAAVRAGMEGRAVIAITIDADGKIVTAVLSESSGYEVLDAAALAAAGRIGHVPKAPEVLAWNRRKVKVPFSFKLRS